MLPPCVSLIGGEPKEASCLAVVLGEAAAAQLVKEPETGLSGWVSLVCGELVETCGLAVVLRQATTALLVEEPEIGLRFGVSLPTTHPLFPPRPPPPTHNPA